MESPDDPEGGIGRSSFTVQMVSIFKGLKEKMCQEVKMGHLDR